MLPYSALTLYALIVLCFTLCYLYFTRNHNYWRNRNVNGPRPWPILGNLYQQLFQPLHVVDLERARKYGRIVGLYEGSRPTLLISDPKILKHIMIRDFATFSNGRNVNPRNETLANMLFMIQDEQWKRVRHSVSPTFSGLKLKSTYEGMTHCVDKFVTHLENLVENVTEMDIKETFGCLSADVILTCWFSVNGDCYTERRETLMKYAAEFFVVPPYKTIITFLCPKVISKLFNASLVPKSSIEWMSSLIRHVLKIRQDQNIYRNDFLQLVLDAGAFRDKKKEGNLDINSNLVNTSSMLSDKEAIAQSLMMLAGGYEPVAVLLALAVYQLAMCPDVQEKLYNDLTQSLGHYSSALSYSFVQKHPYLNAVVSEVLRMYPTSPRMERTANADYQLSGTNIVIERGTLVQTSAQILHHDPEFFPEPGTFLPERFMPEEQRKRLPFTYLPFGAGPRICFGMKLGLVETKLTLVKCLLKFRFIRTPNTVEKPKFKISNDFLRFHPLLVGVEKR